MTDTMSGYIGMFHPKRLSKRELEKMKKIMKTVPLVQKKNEIRHQHEEQEADKEFIEKLQNLE